MEPDSQANSFRWTLPVAKAARPQLKLLNSFTKNKQTFLPRDQRIIRWYSCGPTVYDVAHLGHARCYITFDIIRRILADYFGYHVFYVMNITDIDDKIIKRARSNHLCDKFIQNYLNGLLSSEQLLEQLTSAFNKYKHNKSNEKDPAKLIMIQETLKASEEALLSLKSLLNASSPTTFEPHKAKDILERLREIIANDQDEKFAHTVDDHQVFKNLTLKFERDFHEDMQKLDVLPPSALTRVSEYIHETGEFIKQIESNGFAYRSEGSIYFDTQKFDADPKHTYAKLVPGAYGQKESLDEGEGELSVANQGTKKSPSDFALWKKSKSGEPSWRTHDFEDGRPGWHIECSVMAYQMLGQYLDIHSGGCDLKFPHHDNEIAQSEAFWNTGENWVNYFIHSGHLTISGCKMSKSLKNFITIRDALEQYTSRQLRFAFLAHGWAETLDYSVNTMSTATAYEKTFMEFFLNVADTLRRQGKKCNVDGNKLESYGSTVCSQLQKWTQDDADLNGAFMTAVNEVDVALCNNFDTRSSLNVLGGLVKRCNKSPNANAVLLRDIARYIERMLNIYGVRFNEINFDLLAATRDLSIGDNPDAGTQELILKHVDSLAQFRAEVRKISKTGDPSVGFKQLLGLCDVLRDKTLPDLGVRLEDKEVDGIPYVVKLVDPETLAKERALAEKIKEEKRLQKQKSSKQKQGKKEAKKDTN